MTHQHAGEHQPYGDHSHKHHAEDAGDERHGHDHGSEEHVHSLRGRLLDLVRPHSHDAADSVDAALEASVDGIRAVKVSPPRTQSHVTGPAGCRRHLGVREKVRLPVRQFEQLGREATSVEQSTDASSGASTHGPIIPRSRPNSG